MALVDPHLMHGADICPDHTKASTKQLEKTQRRYLRKMLRLHRFSSIAPLFSETGVVPVRFRRAEMALRYLGYALQGPADGLVWCAMQEAIGLACAGKRSWYADLARALQLLGAGIELPMRVDIDCGMVEGLIERLQSASRAYVSNLVAGNSKLDLLVGRPHPDRAIDGPWGKAPAMGLRAYLRVRIPEHREALTKLLVSEHHLAVERLRYTGVDHDLRLCRHCHSAVEDPVHVVLVCTAREELASLREAFMASLGGKVGAGGMEHLSRLSPKRLLQYLAACEDTVDMFARFVRDVLRLFADDP